MMEEETKWDLRAPMMTAGGPAFLYNNRLSHNLWYYYDSGGAAMIGIITASNNSGVTAVGDVNRLPSGADSLGLSGVWGKSVEAEE